MLKRLMVLCSIMVALIGAGPVSAQDDAGADVPELKVGDAAPDFKLTGSDGKTYTLSEFKGKKHVLLAFFPKSFTPG